MRNPQWLSNIGGILLNKEDVCYCLTDWGRKPSFPVERLPKRTILELRKIEWPMLPEHQDMCNARINNSGQV